MARVVAVLAVTVVLASLSGGASDTVRLSGRSWERLRESVVQAALQRDLRKTCARVRFPFWQPIHPDAVTAGATHIAVHFLDGTWDNKLKITQTRTGVELRTDGRVRTYSHREEDEWVLHLLYDGSTPVGIKIVYVSSVGGGGVQEVSVTGEFGVRAPGAGG